jgi:hypothetical protein
MCLFTHPEDIWDEPPHSINTVVAFGRRTRAANRRVITRRVGHAHVGTVEHAAGRYLRLNPSNSAPSQYFKNCWLVTRAANRRVITRRVRHADVGTVEHAAGRYLRLNLSNSAPSLFQKLLVG